MTDIDKNRRGVARHRERMNATHVNKAVWIPKGNIKRLERIAKTHGWINTTGRNAGQPNVQQAMLEVIKAGLTTLEQAQ